MSSPSNLQRLADTFDLKGDPYARSTNLLLRDLVYRKGDADEEFARATRTLALRDIELMFDLFFWTFDPRKEVPHVPFILYDYQRIDYEVEAPPGAEVASPIIKGVLNRLCYWLDNGEDGFIDKARDMGLSWCVIGAFIWYWLQDKPGNDFLLGSRKFEYVDKKGNMDTLFEKARYLVNHLPKWMRPEGYNPDRHDMVGFLQNPFSGNTIVGEANNKNFGSAARRKGVLFDEMSKWEQTDSDAWTSALNVTDTRLALSTPYGGPETKFYKLRHDMSIHIERMSYPWQIHPEKDDAWYRKKVLKSTPLEIAQELDINYEGAAGKAFVSTYSDATHRRDLTAIPYERLIRLWDFGYHFPFVLFTQIDDMDRWIWLKCILGRDVIAVDFANYVRKMTDEWFPLTEEVLDLGDPAGDYQSDKGKKSTIGLIRQATDINIITKINKLPLNVDKMNTARRMQEMFNEMVAGEPKILVNKELDDVHQDLPEFVNTQSMHYVHRALSGGLHYHKDKVEEYYEKDGFYDHFGDAVRYGIKYLFPMPGISQESRAEEDRMVMARKQKAMEGKAHAKSRVGARRSRAYGQASRT